MTLVIELLEAALVQSTEDLLSLDSAQVKQISLRLNPTEGTVRGIETRAAEETTNLGELIAFARAVQTEPTKVELLYRGRSESFTL
jgi:hypothetical protein